MKDIVVKIKKIEQEQRRRKSAPLAKYNKTKVHAKQMEFHKCQKRNRWVFGGNRTGKTECGAVETVWLALGIHPFRKNVANVACWVVSLSRQVQRDVAQKKILHYLDKSKIEKVVMTSGEKSSPEYGIIDYLVVINVFGGRSTIGFKSCEAGREKFQGASLDFVWFDEEPPEDIYRECQMRVLDKCGNLFGTMTPLKGLSWVYDEIYLNARQNPEVWYEFMDWSDNPYLSAGEVEQMSASMSAEELDSRKYGRFATFGGLVYPEFSAANVIEPFDVPPDWQDAISIDPGLNNPLSCHWYARDGDGNVYVVAEHYKAGKDVPYHAEKIEQISRSLGWKTNRYGGYDVLMDSAAKQRTLSAEKSVAELFADYGIFADTSVNKDLFSGISRVKSMLKPLVGPPKLYVFSTCANMIREIKGYGWGEDDKPVKRDDHAMDELRYYVSYVFDGLSACKNKPRKSAVQADIDRLLSDCRRRELRSKCI